MKKLLLALLLIPSLCFSQATRKEYDTVLVNIGESNEYFDLKIVFYFDMDKLTVDRYQGSIMHFDIIEIKFNGADESCVLRCVDSSNDLCSIVLMKNEGGEIEVFICYELYEINLFYFNK